MVITATADLDEAIADLVHSAFGHAGQKCSAASLAIVEAPVHDDGPLPAPAGGRRAQPASWARRGIWPPRWGRSSGRRRVPCSTPSPGSARGSAGWCRRRRSTSTGYLWSPGVKVGVAPGSPFHLTECFGPVLGIMRAADLDEAIRWQNQPAYGLTAGLHALDPAEIERWRDAVHAGNLYVNRGTTGAIVRRQPFGGWKRSVVGPGAKAGGPNYVASLGTWPARAGGRAGADDYAAACQAGLVRHADARGPDRPPAEANAFRYRPLQPRGCCRGVGVGDDARWRGARAAAAAVGVDVRKWSTTAARGAARPGCRQGAAPRRGGRLDPPGRARRRRWVDDIPVAADARREILRWVREQAVSETLHRHGNVTGRRPGLPRRLGPDAGA